METFGDRMRMIRLSLGSRRDRTTCAGFAREMGLPDRFRLYKWETRERIEPEGGVSSLEELFARVEGVRSRGISPRALAAWSLTGAGPAPFALASQPEVRDPSREPELAEVVDATAPLFQRVEAWLMKGIESRTFSAQEAMSVLQGLRKIGLAGVALLLALGTASDAESAGFQNWRIRPLCQPSENDDDDDEDSEKPDENRPAREAPKRRGRPRCAAPRVEQAPPRSSITEVDDSTQGPRVPIPEAARGAA